MDGRTRPGPGAWLTAEPPEPPPPPVPIPLPQPRLSSLFPLQVGPPRPAEARTVCELPQLVGLRGVGGREWGVPGGEPEEEELRPLSSLQPACPARVDLGETRPRGSLLRSQAGRSHPKREGRKPGPGGAGRAEGRWAGDQSGIVSWSRADKNPAAGRGRKGWGEGSPLGPPGPPLPVRPARLPDPAGPPGS